MSWQDFETECTNYLNQSYGKPGKIKFIHMGKTDSTVSDIQVNIDGQSKFYIEVKMSTSQCGQFVLIPDTTQHKFIFSSRNSSTETAATKQIITYMNQNFNQFNSGGILEMDDKIFYDWVIEHYCNLGTKYIITAHDEKFIIFPLTKLADYFDIKGIFRIKKSGSRAPSETQQLKIINHLKARIPDLSYRMSGNVLIINGTGLQEKDQFDIDNNTYYLAEHSDGYRVRILSKTANFNVIFSIFLKKISQDPADLALFVQDLK